jgi:pilus assembly protein Flp/PilA
MNGVKDLKKAVDSKQQKKEKGASMVEYALLVALIAIIAMVALRVMGQTVSTNFSKIASNLG